MNENVENAQHGPDSMSSRLFQRDNLIAVFCFPNEKNLKLTPKLTKIPKFSKGFSHFLLKFRQTSWIEMF